MPTKQEQKDITYSDALQEIRKLALSLQKTLNTTVKKLNDSPEDVKKESRKAQREAEYQKKKAKYNFTDFDKNLVLDRLIDISQLMDYISFAEYGDYNVEDFIVENVTDFQENARKILMKARNEIEDLLPATVASSGKDNNPVLLFRQYAKNKIAEEEDM